MGAAVNQAVGLVIVHGFSDVSGNHCIVLPKFGHAIDLRRQPNGYTLPLQIARQQHYGRRTPAVTEENDARIFLFLYGKSSIMIGVESAQDRSIRAPAMPVFEDLNESILGAARRMRSAS